MRRAALLALLFCVACGSTDTCDTKTADLGDVCLPATIAPGIPSVIEAREACGNTCDAQPSCTALWAGGQIVLDSEEDMCQSSQSTDCINAGCQHRVVRCVLPSLSEGDYTLLVPGGPARLLRVQGGGLSSCRFPDTGVKQR